MPRVPIAKKYSRPYTSWEMSTEMHNLPSVDWEMPDWKKTPYPGVFILTLLEKPDPENPNVPLSTVMVVRVDPGRSIPLHIHRREPSWTEILTFPEGGNFTIHRIDGSEEISNSDDPFILTIGSMRAFGLTNNDASSLFFSSKMEPGFIGYEEIEMIT